MTGNPPTIEQVLTTLAATPPRLTGLTAGLTDAQFQTAPGPGEWSANDVLAHLRSCADVWGGCIARLVAEDRPTIRAVNPKLWIRSTDYPRLDFHASLRSFSAQRADLLAFLEHVPQDAWSRTATVTGAGAPLQRTVMSFAYRLARHERPHIKQVERIVNTLNGASLQSVPDGLMGV